MRSLSYLLIVFCLSLSACGGGSTSASDLPSPIASNIPEGVYSGTIKTIFTGPGVNEEPQENNFKFNVDGYIEGQQTVTIRFKQWSGSSAIVLPSNSFSIPSGVFIRDNKSFGQCKVEVTYSGSFSGPNASGIASGVWNCSEARGPIQQNTTFNVTHGTTVKSKIGNIETEGPITE